MTSLSERLDDYAVLPPDERSAVDRDVAASGSAEAARRLADARAFAALLDSAAAGPVTSDDVGVYLADLSLGLEPSDAGRVRAALDADPALRAEAARVQARLDALHADAEAPAAQLERLAGHRLPAPAAAATPPAAGAQPRALRDPRADRSRASDRSVAAPPRSRAAIARRALVLATVVLAAYGGLFGAFGSEKTDRSRVTDLGDLASYEAPTMRGAEPDALPARLDAALDAVADARRSTIGLFPRYDAAALDAASAELAAVIGASDAASTVSQEARLALARVHLYRGRDAEAVRLLGALVREQSYRGPEARRLLDFVRTQDGA